LHASRLIFAWCLGIGLICAPTFADESNHDELSELWQEGVRALARENYSDALEVFSRWQSEAKEAGFESSELHYNLGIIHLNLKQPGPAVFHLLTSARLSDSPLRVWKTLTAVSQVEKNLGVKENVIDSQSFRLAFLLGRNWVWLAMAVGIWAFLGGVVRLWWKGFFTPSSGALIIIGLFCAMLSALGYFNRKFLARPAVLVAGQNIPIYSEAQAKKAVLLVELPSGTVVSLAEPQGEFTRINSPVAGWVETNSLRAIP
jgi:hypothetical protein